MSTSQNPMGRVRDALVGRYTIERELGAGGMATVYLATDVKHKRQVAVKVLRPELSAGLGAQRFVREIEIASRLSHPHILPLFDSGEADGLLYYVMPFVEGESLDDRLAREGKLSTDAAVRLTDQVASALTYAHEHGVIHRDIKPGNILLMGDQAVVADFGIARAVEAASAEGLTGTGTAVGTPSYMAPEQAFGGSEVDARTDVYALGCVVWEMITGEQPFKGKTPAALLADRVLLKGLSVRDTDPSLPLFVDRALGKALATDPEQRFETAAEFSEALTTGTVVQQVRSRTRRTGMVWAAGVAGLVLIAWVVSLWMQAPRMGSLAVLPLEDLTGDPDQAYLAAGVHEALIAELGSLGIDMISRATMARFANSGLGIPDIATELGVDGVMEGAVLLDGDSLAISARLYDSNEEEVWAGTFEGVFPDLIALYRGFARAIAEEIQLRLAPEDEARLNQEPAVNPAVYEPYLRGMTVLHTAGTPQAFQQAIDYFNEAIAADPADALAWAALAQCYVTLGHNQLIDTSEIWALGRAAALRAIRLDSMSAEGWAALADYEAYHGRDWAAAEEAFLRADALNPSLAWNHYHYSWFLVLFGRIEEAVREHERAAQLDPLTPFHTVWMPALYWFNRDFERAYQEARANVDGAWADNFTAIGVLAVSASETGRHDEAIAAARKMNELRGVIGMLGRTHARAGRIEEALEFAEQLEEPPTHPGQADALAHIYGMLGDMEKALYWLEREPRSFLQPATLLMPYMDPLRDNPRFIALLRKANLALEPGWDYPVAVAPEHDGLPSVNGEAGAGS